MTRRFASRYWSSLTGRQRRLATPPTRGRAGYSFGHRYLAALLGISLPPRPAPPRRSSEHAVAFAAPPAPPPPETEFRQALRVRPRHGWALAMGIVAISAFSASVVFVAVDTDDTDRLNADPPASHAPSSDVPAKGDPSWPFSFIVPDTVPRCMTVEGIGTTPDKGAAVLIVRETDAGGIYFGGRLEFRGDFWFVAVMLGTEVGQEFELSIHAVTPDTAEEVEQHDSADIGPPLDTAVVTVGEVNC